MEKVYLWLFFLFFIASILSVFFFWSFITAEENTIKAFIVREKNLTSLHFQSIFNEYECTVATFDKEGNFIREFVLESKGKTVINLQLEPDESEFEYGCRIIRRE